MDYRNIINLDHKNPIAQRYLRFWRPVTNFLARKKINPNTLTIFGAVLVLAAGFFIYQGKLITGVIILLFGVQFDALDGTVARLQNRTTRFGAYLDSLLDRYAEVIIFLAIYFYYFDQLADWQSLIFWLALTGSLLVSYSRARSEGLGIKCEIGLMQRAPRIIILIIVITLASWISLNTVTWLMLILAVFSHFTVIQRSLHLAKNR